MILNNCQFMCMDAFCVCNSGRDYERIEYFFTTTENADKSCTDKRDIFGSRTNKNSAVLLISMRYRI